MHKAGWIALFLSFCGILAAYLVSNKVLENVPHVEDEMAYVWQAEVYAHGHLTAPSPADPSAFMVPFVVDRNGQRFAKYPPGWPMLLAVGIKFGLRDWINPLLAGLAVWLTYRLGKKVFSPTVGLIAAFLTITSPFFLMISGTLDSDPLSLVLSLVFISAWLDTFGLVKKDESNARRPVSPGLTASVAGLSLGLLFITRPLTAVGVALAGFIHGLILLVGGKPVARKWLVAIGSFSVAVGLLFFFWQFKVTGSPLLDPYTLWWKFDRIGFGPGIGVAPGGYSLSLGLKNAKDMLSALSKDLFGWKNYSWLFLPFGLWAIRRNKAGLLTFSVAASLVVCYLLYWAEVGNYGPRYYYEGLFSLTLASAAGIAWLAEQARQGGWQGMRTVLVGGLVTGLVVMNFSSYLPARLKKIYGLYGIHQSQLAPFRNSEAKNKTPALVFVHLQKSWTDYAGLIELEDPWLTTPYIFAQADSPAKDAAIAQDFPNRTVFDYYPDSPIHFVEWPNR